MKSLPIPNFSRTMLVIGAGAHVPYGMPSSIGLTKTIKSLVSECGRISFLNPSYISDKTDIQRDKLKICQLMASLEIVKRGNDAGANGFDIRVGDFLDSFVTSFARSGVYSIDRYLAQQLVDENDTEKARLGKLLIAYFISRFENQIPFGFREFDWIEYIINDFLIDKRNHEAFFNRPPRFITFNYDNILERRLIDHLVEYHRYPTDEAREMISKLNVVHVYGDLNSHLLPDRSDSFYLASSARIKVIGEDRKDLGPLPPDAFFLEALREVNNVYFLGFGFDSLNMERLFNKTEKAHSKKDLRDINFYSTNIGLSLTDINRISASAPFDINLMSAGNCDSLKLIRELAPIFRSLTSK